MESILKLSVPGFSIEDTDFSPPATAVMFLLTIHPTALEAGDFLSTGVKIPTAETLQ